MPDILDWLRECQEHNLATAQKRKRSLTPELSSMGSKMDTCRGKQSNRGNENENRNDQDIELPDVDAGHLPVAYPFTQSESYSTTSSTTTSRQSSPTRRLMRLEISPHNPFCVVSIDRRDPRMPRMLKTTLAQLETFQRGYGVVPKQLAPDVEARQARQRRSVADGSPDGNEEGLDDGEFYNFRPSVFCREDEEPYWNSINLDDVFDVLTATQMCVNDRHPESSWNMLVHWPIFKLALEAAGTDIPTTSTAATTANPKAMHTRVSCVPCTTARITGRDRGSKMVDFCITVQPREPHSAAEAERAIRELRGRTDGSAVNHTDFYPLRDKPIVISARSTKPGGGLLEAETQVGVWQAAQWSLLSSQSKSGKDGATRNLPFLPALFIQGSQWFFAATTRRDDQTVSLTFFSYIDAFTSVN